MGSPRGLGLRLIAVCIFLVATTYTCLGLGNISVVCSEQERLALVNFKHSVEDVFGMLSSWVGNDCCTWDRIHCDVVTGNVKGVNLRGDWGSFYYNDYEGYNEFVGEGYLVGFEVNTSLAELRHVSHLDLSGNDFHGSRIPQFIGSLKNLSYLNLSHAGFQGIIPHNIGNLSNLNVLDLSSNRELMADDMSWTFGLSSLEHLNLSFSNLTGAHNVGMLVYMIPSLQLLSLSDCGLSNADLSPFHNSSRILPNMKHLDLGFNFFRGPLPYFFQNMTSLAFLDLSNFTISLAWNFADMLNMIPSLSELHLSWCGLDNSFLSPFHLNSSTLSNIQNLDLRGNLIEGIFPFVLTNMSSLRILDLSGNLLNSSVPVIPNLLELDLSSNRFKQIKHVGIWRQCHLKKLSASNNYFDKEMIESPTNISECSQYSLERLDLSWSLNGTIPESLGRMANLKGIYLAHNNLTGSIPESLTFLEKLSELDLSYNQLNGSIPESLGKLGALTYLNLRSNLLRGSIPTFPGKISKLDLSFNQLNGSIPESFGKLAALTDLDVGFNRLMGPLPVSLGRLVSLRRISAHSNLLTGPIVVSIGQLAKLQYLDISNNSLEGAMSEAHFATLSILRSLDASFNTKLTFNVSREWIPPFQLHFLDLSSCNIANGLPQWIRHQRKLKRLVLSNSSFSGPLPTWLQKMPIIPVLDLSHNKLTGPLTNLPNGENVNVFDYGFYNALFLENNLFNESIPKSLCRMKYLVDLDLSGNRLTGKIPKCLENMKELHTIIFSSNRMYGVVPSFIANSLSLYRLKLNDNNFIGELPEDLGNLHHLLVLDLGGNRLSGNIPDWIGENLKNLMVLRLHKNNFTGRIPRSLCKSSNLNILDVSYNKLTGTIPNCLGELNRMAKNDRGGSLFVEDVFQVLKGVEVEYTTTSLPADDVFQVVKGVKLEYAATSLLVEDVFQVVKGVELEYTTTWVMVFNMDLSSNNLVGEIPSELTALSMLMGLNLSNNHLTGIIPNNIGNMKRLESLDFSKNDLSGMIPSSIAALNFLSHLNLSHNNLSGRIPTGNQLQTLNDPSIYAGNKYLCGPPLPNACSTTTRKRKYNTTDEQAEVWSSYVDIMSGFATGFWGIIGVLWFKKQWRDKVFMFAEKTMDKIYNAVMVRVAKLKRGREAALIHRNASYF